MNQYRKELPRTGGNGLIQTGSHEFRKDMIARKREYKACPEDSERRQVLAQVAQSFLGTIES